MSERVMLFSNGSSMTPARQVSRSLLLMLVLLVMSCSLVPAPLQALAPLQPSSTLTPVPSSTPRHGLSRADLH
jgi:hypothetical protein